MLLLHQMNINQHLLPLRRSEARLSIAGLSSPRALLYILRFFAGIAFVE